MTLLYWKIKIKKHIEVRLLKNITVTLLEKKSQDTRNTQCIVPHYKVPRWSTVWNIFGIIVPHFVIERLGYLGNKDRFIVPLLHCYIPIHLYTGFIGSHIIVFCPTFTLQVDDQSEKTTNIDEK